MVPAIQVTNILPGKPLRKQVRRYRPRTLAGHRIPASGLIFCFAQFFFQHAGNLLSDGRVVVPTHDLLQMAAEM